MLYRLQNKVIDLEVENETPSPTVDPSVHVFLIGHSMGGIVGAETLLLLSEEQPIPPQESSDRLSGSQRLVEPGSFMFPHIQGLLAFDTPFLGIAPGVVSYGAEGHYKTATTAYTALTEVAGFFGYGSNDKPNPSTTKTPEKAAAAPKPLPAASPAADAAATPSWQRWGRYAMFAGAAGAVAAGGAAAYTQRSRISAGLNWVSSHLEFVGCLGRTADLRKRLKLLAKIEDERGIRSTNFYTCLGEGAPSLVENTTSSKTSFSQRIIRSKNRTFCCLPPEIDGQETEGMDAERIVGPPGLQWIQALNNKASDEVKAHISMFIRSDNPGLSSLTRQTCEVIFKSIDKGWYSTATARTDDSSEPGSGNTGFMDVDADDVVIV
ncbi:hypothetical protein ASPZODRAFT_128365, partial [Penicilliopsis zonata CBS 506.65]